MSRLVAVAALASILLTGCATTQENSIDHVEAKAQLEKLLTIAEDAIGGEWEHSDTGARDCRIGGATGASYVMTRLGQAVAQADQQAILDSIAAAWAKNGVNAAISTKPEVNNVVVTQLRYPDAGVDTGGFYVELWISDRASTIGGQSRCGIGDAATINGAN